jgi:aminoglycoside 2''-phosphotransferase
MSFYEARNPADISVEKVLPHVKNFLPNIEAENIRFFYHGTYNVFEISNKYILRVSDRGFRNKQGLDMLRMELRILNFLRLKLPIEIPKMLFFNESAEIPFSIHEKIPGKSLTFVIQQFNEEQKTSISTEIGKFLSILHSRNLKNDFLLSFPKQKNSDINFIDSFKEYWISRFDQAKDLAYKYLKKDQKEWLTKIFNDYLNDKDNFKFTPSITHCDFDTSNILVDPENGQITGIIDFENCKIWDPAADLLFFDEGSDFMKSLLNNYRFSQQKSLLARMKFFYCRTCVAYLVWGTNHKRPGMIEEGLRLVKHNMNMFPIE